MTYEQVARTYYSMSEVAFILEESQSAIRFWLKCFDIRVARSAGNRKFTEADIKKLHRVKDLIRVTGLTHEGVKRYIKNKGWK